MRASILFAVVMAIGCESGAVPAVDGGPRADGGVADARIDVDASNPVCDVDRACPEAAPVWGGPCEGTLTCPFVGSCGGTDQDVYECVSGEWSLTMPAPCAGGSPPQFESCRDPFTGTLSGATLTITADRAGAPPIVDGDLVEIAWGAQGLAMIPYRVVIEGTEVPACVSVTATLTLDALAGTAATHDVRLRCGSSLSIQDILPDLPCESREYAVGIDVSVEGVGALHRDVRVMGGMCSFGG